MKCPICKFKDTKVLESRLLQDDLILRRRRACPKCEYRYTTYEREELDDRVEKVLGKAKELARLLKDLE